jgi:cellulose biosynthesis protein BcsQ
MQNGGAPNVENPKLAARYFLDSINRVVGMAERYEKELVDINKQIPEILELTKRQFDQEFELATLKQDLDRLEIEISRNIAEKEKEQAAQLQITEPLVKETDVELLEPATVYLKR